MNRQFHNKRQSLTVTDKYTGIGKLFDWSKNFTVDMFNIKLEEKSNNMSFKALSVKIQRSKNRQGGVGEQNVPAHPTPPLGQIGLNILEFLWYLFLELLLVFKESFCVRLWLAFRFSKQKSYFKSRRTVFYFTTPWMKRK